MTGDPGRRGLGSSDVAELAGALRERGLFLDLGAAEIRVRSRERRFAEQIQRAYHWYPLDRAAEWADLHVRIRRPRSMRRWANPQILFESDSQVPFAPFPADSALPLFEWGTNWLIGRTLNHLLLFHAGVVERGGRALLLPAMPGSGKSTLTAALAQRGWRLLSDEFGAYDPAAGVFRALLKPVALKNQSIGVIRSFAPDAIFGPEFPKTRKGTVAHMAAGPESVAKRRVPAMPGAVVLPRWSANSATRWQPLDEYARFSALAFNAFNYKELAGAAFSAAVHLARACPGRELVYSDLDEALATLDAWWPEVLGHHGGTATC